MGVGLVATFQAKAHWSSQLIFALAGLMVGGSFLLREEVHTPTGFKVPLSPLTPTCGMLSTIFLMGSLGPAAYVRFAVWLFASTMFYLFYSIHKEERVVEDPTATTAAAGHGGETTTTTTTTTTTKEKEKEKEKKKKKKKKKQQRQQEGHVHGWTRVVQTEERAQQNYSRPEGTFFEQVDLNET